MAEILRLPNASVANNEPVPELVELLEGQLAEAREGRLRGIAYVKVLADLDGFLSPTTGWHSVRCKGELGIGLVSLNYRMGGAWSSG